MWNGLTKSKEVTLVSLSEQELVDCDRGDHSCQGGFVKDAFECIRESGGLSAESRYPYNGIGTFWDDTKIAVDAGKISGYEDMPANENHWCKLWPTNQFQLPLMPADNPSCPTLVICGTNLDHGVTVVGFGTAEDGNKYWLVNNSWGHMVGRRGIHTHGDHWEYW